MIGRYFFEHLYHLTIEKIRRFYHNLNGMPRIETYKGFKWFYADDPNQPDKSKIITKLLLRN